MGRPAGGYLCLVPSGAPYAPDPTEGTGGVRNKNPTRLLDLKRSGDPKNQQAEEAWDSWELSLLPLFACAVGRPVRLHERHGVDGPSCTVHHLQMWVLYRGQRAVPCTSPSASARLGLSGNEARRGPRHYHRSRCTGGWRGGAT